MKRHSSPKREAERAKLSPDQIAERKIRRCGRKPLYRETMVAEGYKLGALGLVMTEIADFWNIAPANLYRWSNKHPELKAAVDRGRNEADATVIQALLTAARTDRNITAIIFWLKNRQPEKWKDLHTLKGEGFANNLNFHIDRRVSFVIQPEEADPDPQSLHAPEGPDSPSGALPV